MNHHKSSPVEVELEREISAVQSVVLEKWRGHETEGLIALVRQLDLAAIRKIFVRSSNNNETILSGAAIALRPFLHAVKGRRGGVPWTVSSDEVALFMDSYLAQCGHLAQLKRIASLERYGLATTSIQGRNATLNTTHGHFELAALRAIESLPLKPAPTPPPGGNRPVWRRIRRRMRSYVYPDPIHFIGYDNDLEIVGAFRERATSYGRNVLEGEALPDDVTLGDRTFSEWKFACDQALGRILCHIEFARLLIEKHPYTRMGNVATIFTRREDAADVWREAGMAESRIDPTMKALTLDFHGLDDWNRATEVPCPFYVDLGKDFLLLPCFGALTNHYFALFRHLRHTYRTDWDKGVDRRESIFRADMAKAFPKSRYVIPSHGAKLRRMDGTLLTDVDAVILDKQSGRLALVQLKWHDIFGRSLAERESRRLNIEKANEWVSRVSSWVSDRSSRDIAKAIGLDGPASDTPPVLYVVARYMARFSGDREPDERASWMAWPEMLLALETSHDHEDVLSQIPRSVHEHQTAYKNLPDEQATFTFPTLSVDLHIGSELS